MRKCWLMAGRHPAKRVCRTHSSCSWSWLVLGSSPPLFSSWSPRLLSISSGWGVLPSPFTMKPNDVKPGGWREGGGSLWVYGGSGLSPVKTQVTVINSRAENEFCLEKNYISLPKSRLNFAWKKNYTSAWKICSVNRPQKYSAKFYFRA